MITSIAHPLPLNRHIALPPEKIGPYTIQAQMGSGGMGTVYQCQDPVTHQRVAIKTLRTDNVHQRALFRMEMTILRNLNSFHHPGIVRLLQACEAGSQLWYAMPYIDSMPFLPASMTRLNDTCTVTLSRLTDNISHINATTFAQTKTTLLQAKTTVTQTSFKPLPPATRKKLDTTYLSSMLACVHQLANTLAFLHGEGYVHCDLKPHNILHAEPGKPILIDFGTCMRTSQNGQARDVLQFEELQLGTSYYMAPEQIRGDSIDARVDLYALGCILYQLVTGNVPFQGASSRAVCAQHLHIPPLPPSAIVDNLPPVLETLILRLLEKDHRQRIGYAEDVTASLDKILSTLNAIPKLNLTTITKPAPYLYRPSYIDKRSGLLAKILHQAEQAYAGQGQQVLVGAQSGSGKTRLSNEVATRCRAKGFKTIICPCAPPTLSVDQIETQGRSPFEALHPFLQFIDDKLLEQKNPNLNTLRQSFTPLLRYYTQTENDLPATPDLHLPDDLKQRRALLQMAACIDAAAQFCPLLIIIDDLHWADEFTAALFRPEVLTTLQQSPVIMLGTYRKEEVHEDFAKVLKRQPREPYTIDPLDSEAIHQFVCEALAMEIAPVRLMNFLIHHSEGNAFFVSEYLRSAIKHQLLRRSPAATWELTAPEQPLGQEYESLPLPLALEELISNRYQKISQHAATLVDFAAILGREFPRRLLDLDKTIHETNPQPAIDELIRHEIIEHTAADTIRFQHDKLREIRLTQMLPALRQQLHHRAAQLYEQYAQQFPLSQADAIIGQHWASAGFANKAFGPLQAAAKRAGELFAPRDAILLHRLALNQYDNLDNPTQTTLGIQYLSLRESLADLLTVTAHHDEALSIYQQNLNLLLDTTSTIATKIRHYRKISKCYQNSYRLPQSMAALITAANQLQNHEEHSSELAQEHFEVNIALAYAHYLDRNPSAGSDVLIRMRKRVFQENNSHHIAHYYHVLANCNISQNQYAYQADNVQTMKRALSLINGTTYAYDANFMRFDTAFMLLMGSRQACAEAIPYLTQAWEEAKQLMDIPAEARCSVYLALGYRRLDDIKAARTTALSALQIAATADNTTYRAFALSILAWTELRSQNKLNATEYCAQAEILFQGETLEFPLRWSYLLVQLELELKQSTPYPKTIKNILERLIHERQARLPDVITTIIHSLLNTLDSRLTNQHREQLKDLTNVAQAHGYI